MNTKQLLTTLIILVIGFAVGVTTLSVTAQTSGCVTPGSTWTGPSSAPTGGNICPPLNTGTDWQGRMGQLSIGKTTQTTPNTPGLEVIGGALIDAITTVNLGVTGTASTSNLVVTTGAGAGKVLTSDAQGHATWQTPTATANSTDQCNTVTVQPKPSGATYDLEAISLLINGQNICKSARGCYVDIWNDGSSSSSKLYVDYYGSAELFRQSSIDNRWFFSATNYTGVNGDSTQTDILLNSEGWHGMGISDDFTYSSSYGSQNNQFGNTAHTSWNEHDSDWLTIRNTSGNFFDVSVCKTSL